MFTYKIKCRQCEGSGVVELIKDCIRPVSMCCGGCTEEAECEECDGTGDMECCLETIRKSDELLEKENQIKMLELQWLSHRMARDMWVNLGGLYEWQILNKRKKKAIWKERRKL
jgi:RecJ-like exonuclease